MNTPVVPGAVAGSARLWLRAEGAVVLLLGVLLYSRYDYSWILFAALFLLPDLSAAAYLAGSRLGAAAYNTMHSYALPLAAVAVCLTLDVGLAVPLIWIAHIGFDRALGYGLKYPTAFGHTHLGTIGRARGLKREYS